MNNFSVFFTILFYIVIIIFIVGIARKIKQYATTPAPLKIPVAPAPLTKGGVILRMFREVVFFESLFKSNKWTWLFGWLFHIGLLLVLIRHIRYFWPADVPSIFLLTQPFKYASFLMAVGLIGLFVRRITVARVRYISSPSDYLMLLLLAIITISGIVMTFISHTDIIMVKNFASGILTLNWSDLPLDIHFIIHLLLVFVLLAIFPISKLLHAPGVFFSPTRTQVDNARKVRHISPWARNQEINQEVKLTHTLGKDE